MYLSVRKVKFCYILITHTISLSLTTISSCLLLPPSILLNEKREEHFFISIILKLFLSRVAMFSSSSSSPSSSRHFTHPFHILNNITLTLINTLNSVSLSRTHFLGNKKKDATPTTILLRVSEIYNCRRLLVRKIKT